MHPRRLLWIATVPVLLGAMLALAYFRSHERLLERELVAYYQSCLNSAPRPDLVTQISEKSVPVLLRWLTEPERPLGRVSLRRALIEANELFPQLGLNLPQMVIPRPELALLGFDWLGTNAATAVPHLTKLLPHPTNGPYAAAALVSIGPPAYDVALRLAQSSDPKVRQQGASALGMLQLHPGQSVPALTNLAHDPVPHVRSEALRALAEFCSPAISEMFSANLTNPATANDAAYLLQADPTALLKLADTARASTNHAIRSAALAALAFRDIAPTFERSPEPRRFIYANKRAAYNVKTLTIAFHLYNADPAEQARLIEAARSNILATGAAKIDLR